MKIRKLQWIALIFSISLMGCARTFRLSPVLTPQGEWSKIKNSQIEIVDRTSDNYDFSSMTLTIENKKESLKETILSAIGTDNQTLNLSGKSVLVSIEKFSLDFSVGTYRCEIGAKFSILNQNTIEYQGYASGSGSSFNTWPNSYELAVNQAIKQFSATIPIREIQIAYEGTTKKIPKTTAIALTNTSVRESNGINSATKGNLAILPLEANGVEKSISLTLTDLLINNMQSNGCYRVLERSQIDKILKEQGFQNSGACSASECAIEMGKLLSIQKMIIGSIGQLGNSYVINIRLINVQTGEIENNSSRQILGGIENSATIVGSMISDLCK